MTKTALPAALLSAALLSSTVAVADDPAAPAAAPSPPPQCTLQRLAALDMTTEPDGEVTIPATIEGQQGQMLVDTGSIFSVIGESEARARGLRIELANVIVFYLGGVPMYQMTRTKQVSIGQVGGKDLPLMVINSQWLSHDVIGMLGPDLMRNFDLDFDFAAGTLNLFSPDHCAGNVVYWTKAAYAAVPMRLDEGGHVVIDVVLNGKPVSAVVDTGADRSTITLALAKSLFGIDTSDPKLVNLGNVSVNGTADAPVYRYPFDTLTLEGVAVNNPSIDILDGKRFEVGDNRMILGIKTLRQLHMYLAYKEGMIYFTPAEAR